jgi:hypothetical protein
MIPIANSAAAAMSKNAFTWLSSARGADPRIDSPARRPKSKAADRLI